MPREGKPKKEKMTLEEWRARRARRREKQREENFGRAAKMHEARWEMEAADLEHAPSPPRDSAHVGCSGWFY